MLESFATSNQSAMTPLSFRGIRVTDCHEQIRGSLAASARYLAQRGMPDAATFLAEPVHGPYGRIDWYTNLSEKPVPMTGLPADRQEAVRRRLAACGRAIGELARYYRTRNSMTSHMLLLALQHPAESDVYVSGDRIVLINWGFASGTSIQTEEHIMRLGAAGAQQSTPSPVPTPAPAPASEAASVPATGPGVTPPVPAGTHEAEPPAPAACPVHVPPETDTCQSITAAAAPPAAGGAISGCLSWLPALLFFVLLAWLLAAIAGLMPSPLPAGCFHREVAMDLQVERGIRLAGEAQDLTRVLLSHAARCVPPAPEVPKEEPQPEPEKPKEEPKAEEPGPMAEAPFFGAPDPAPEPEPKPAPKAVKKPQKKPPRGQAMQIPRDAAKRNDLSFLEGCWRSVTDLVNTHGRPIVGEYCFKANGRGSRVVHQEDGSVCVGPVRGSFRGGRLHIRSGEAPCGNGVKYVPQDVQCRGTGTSTRCDGQDDLGDGGRRGNGKTRWDATFVRK